MLLFLGREIVDGRDPSSATIRGLLYRLAVAEHCVIVLMAFLNRVCTPFEFLIPNRFGHDARMRVSSCLGILFPLPQHAHEFTHGNKIQNLVEGTRFDSVMSLLAIWRVEDLNCAAEGWSCYEFGTAVARDMPACQHHIR